MKLCLNATYFSLGGYFYKQASGFALATAISDIDANLTVEHIEKLAMETFFEPLKAFLRYVDDVFCVIKKSNIDNFLPYLN